MYRETKHDGNRVRWFDSLAQFRDEFYSAGCQPRENSGWTNETRAESTARFLSGDASAVPEAEKLIQRLSMAVNIETDGETWSRDVAGFFPCVPSFLAGVPENMMMRRADENTAAPVRVFVDVTSSAGISAAKVQARGAALLAFVLMLSRVRPVELNSVCGLGGGNEMTCIIRHNSHPMMIAECAWCLSSAAFPRGIIYEYCGENGTSGAWPKYQRADNYKAGEHTRRAFGLAPDSPDVLIPPIHLGDKLLTNPAAWIVSALRAQGIEANATTEARA